MSTNTDTAETAEATDAESIHAATTDAIIDIMKRARTDEGRKKETGKKEKADQIKL